MVPDVIAAVKTYIKLIINHGGTKVVVVGAFQIGCGVKFDFHGGTKFHCNNSSFNSLATLHNQLLKEELRRLRDEFPGTRIVYGDMWDAFQWIMDHFWSIGYRHPYYIPCCGNAHVHCGDSGAPYCNFPAEYMYWDSEHLTDHTHRLLSNLMIPRFAADLGCGGGVSKDDDTSEH
ncbi:unnamed protein product [Linum trigynum]|uniref:GDSL esterase/lipase n=1 Tax=Linum trigynum TaxID=586398 RepID=A0AAV2DK03_9ROSI